MLYDKKVLAFIESEREALESNLESALEKDEWNPLENCQTIWADFQKCLRSIARERAKIATPQLTREIQETEAKIELTSDDTTLSDKERSISNAVLKEKLFSLLQHQNKNLRNSSKLIYALFGETISKYWLGLNKDKKPRELIRRLEKVPLEQAGDIENNPHQAAETVVQKIYETNSQKMADMMRDHHEALQTDDSKVEEEVRQRRMTQTLDRISVQVSGIEPLI
ncbi:hypothetical protein EV360DRAFT_75987 [Lentinula raphanica]|nr:hypothetical protein EV360DRAFT_75987 [Lentinula raphanica]